MNNLELNKSTLLIVDDSASILDFLIETLKPFGYRLLVAARGEEVFERLKKLTPDLILLDVVMPGISGFDVCKTLKESPETRDIPVIFMTALTDTENKVKGLRLGAVDYIAKPIEIEELNARISTHLTISLLQKQLKRLNDELEEKVEDRTRTLEDTNQALISEINVRQEAEKALKTSEEKYFNLVKNINDLISEMDTEGILTFAGLQYQEALGYQPGELIGTSFFNLLHLNQPEETINAYKEILKKIGHSTDLWRMKHKNGEIRWIECKSSRYTTPEEKERIVIISRDITERIKHKEEREQLIFNLRKKNSELERFAYMISHDLRTPLITINGFLGELKASINEDNKEDAEQDIAFIENAVNKMYNILNDLIELCKIGKLTRPHTPINLNKIVHEAMELLTGRIRDKVIHIQIDQQLPTVMGDPNRITEVYLNLIENAVKFMGTSKEPKIEIGWYEDKNRAVLFVKDNGIGIEPQYQSKVFDLFDKLDKNSEGTGIGLSLVKEIIEVHHGKLWVESTGKNKGASFYFSLALAK